MLKGMSGLNPNAAPYIPVSNQSGADNEAFKELMGVSKKSECVGEAANCQLPDSVSLKQSLGELHNPYKSFSEIVHPYYSDNNSIHHESFDAEKQSLMDESHETSSVVDFLMSRFPTYSAESLADFLKFNNGNLDDTIDFLEEFEDARSVSAESSGTSEIRHGVDPSSEATEQFESVG